MVKPEPCVLFANSFVHPQLDEYVDEVRFSEPVVISSCEIVEQNASPSCPTVSLPGASWPQSFALELFVQCDGEARFRHLCSPFLYSPSSSNTLELFQPVMTNYLVIRGSYRVLSLVIYGNTAEELGQYDLDNSLGNLSQSATEGKIEDLPLPLQARTTTFEETIVPLRYLHLIKPNSPEVLEILGWTCKLCQLILDQSAAQKLVKLLLSAATALLSVDLSTPIASGGPGCPQNNLVEIRNELTELYKKHVLKTNGSENGMSEEHLDFRKMDESIQSNACLNIFKHWLDIEKRGSIRGISMLSQRDAILGGLSAMQLFCTSVDGCRLFVKAGGIQDVTDILRNDSGLSPATTLMALAVIEHSCRFSFGCAAFLGCPSQENSSVEMSSSEGYKTLLRLLIKQRRHDIGCYTAQLLHRLHAYEIIVSFESAIEPLLECSSVNKKIEDSNLSTLVRANRELRKLMKILNFRDAIDDPSPVAHASKLLIADQEDGCLPFKATIGLLHASKHRIFQRDIDPFLLSIIKERNFLSLIAALLSSPSLRSATGTVMDAFIDTVAAIEAILLSFLFCRSGLLFLLSDLVTVSSLLQTLRGSGDKRGEEFLSLRYASVLISKGFFCPPKDIGVIIETSLKVVCAIDRVVAALPHSEEMLWALWDLCSISRSDIGRQAVLSMSVFPEAISILLGILQSGKDPEITTSNSSTWPLNLAIFHAAAELFEVLITDSAACTLSSWIPHAVDLHKALHSSSPGSNKKDAPTRLIEWLDPAFVYCKRGVIGLLKYSAILASGGEAQLTSTSFLISESLEMDVGDSGGATDFQPVEILLGKLVTEKLYDGITLPDPSILQLISAMRILAFVAEHPAVAGFLYEEGAVTVLYAIIMNSAFMLERSSSTYDYLVDDGAECNTTADLLLERSRETHIVEMLFSSLILLSTILRKLHEAGEQHHNTRLLNALLRLHREISPKLAARTGDLLFTYASSTLALGAVSHLVVSCLACWPAFGWTPGLFQRLLESASGPAPLTLGPKEACSMLCLLGDLFPEEGIWLWKNGSSSLNALKTLGVGTLTGLRSIAEVDWYLSPPYLEKLLVRLSGHLDKIAQIVLHFSCTALVVLQDMLRVLIIRMACQKTDHAVVLLLPLLNWIQDCLNGSGISEIDIFKMGRMAEFLTGLLEHPTTKKILIKEGIVDILTRILDKIIESLKPSANGTKDVSSLWLECSSPIFKSLSLICDPSVSVYPVANIKRRLADCPTFASFCRIILYLLKCCSVMPIGKDLQGCWEALTAVGSHLLGRAAFTFVALQLSPSFTGNTETNMDLEKISSMIASDELHSQPIAPFMSCWQNLLAFLKREDVVNHETIEITRTFVLSTLYLCAAGKSGYGMIALKSLFGFDRELAENSKSNLNSLLLIIDLLNEKKCKSGAQLPSQTSALIEHIKISVRAMVRLLEKPIPAVNISEIVAKMDIFTSGTDFEPSCWELPPHLSLNPEVLMRIEKDSAATNENMTESSKNEVAEEPYFAGSLSDKFMWECPDTSTEKPPAGSNSMKRKATSLDGSNRRQKLDGVTAGGGVEGTATSAFVRSTGSTVPSGPTRRDTFRQRKPNTSRPPSMHVDDYVARERNNDVTSNAANVAGGQRTMGGRPPSMHVDEFMARQRERQQPAASTVGQQTTAQASPLESDNSVEKSKKPRQLKRHLDDDPVINIDFDVVPGAEDVLPFDDALQSASLNIAEASSPDSVTDDTELNINNNSNQRSKRAKMNASEDKGQLYAATRGETPLRRDQYGGRSPNSASTKSPERMHFYNHSTGFQGMQPGEGGSVPSPSSFDRAANSRPGPELKANLSQSQFEQTVPLQTPPLPPLPPPPAIPSGLMPQVAESSSGYSSAYAHSTRDPMPPMPSGSPYRSFDPSTIAPPFLGREQKSPKDYYAEGNAGNLNTSRLMSQSINHSLPEAPRPPPALQFHPEHPRPSFSQVSSLTRPPFDTLSGTGPPSSSRFSGSTSRTHEETAAYGRHQPPLPPMPPPFLTSGGMHASPKSSASQASSGIQLQTSTSSSFPPLPSTGDKAFGGINQASSLHSYGFPPAFVPPLPPGRPTTTPGAVSGNLSTKQVQGNHIHSQSVQHQPYPQPSQQTLHSQQLSSSPQPPLPPPPQPQQPRPLQPQPPLTQRSQTQMPSSANQQHTQFHLQPPALQHSILSQIALQHQPTYFQQQNQSLLQTLTKQEDSSVTFQQYQQQSSIKQDDSSLSLQQYFSSPEAIQALLSDQEKLRQFLEQNPKLMQVLQEKLRQV